MTRAPRSTAQRIARASASGEIVPSARTTFATSSCAGKPMPAIPVLLFELRGDQAGDERPVADRILARRSASRARTTARPSMRPSNSGWLPSMPESMTATFTDPSDGLTGQSGQASKAWMAPRYHCLLRERIVRREREAPRALEPFDVRDARTSAAAAAERSSSTSAKGVSFRTEPPGGGLDARGHGVRRRAALEADRVARRRPPAPTQTSASGERRSAARAALMAPRSAGRSRRGRSRGVAPIHAR